MLIISNCCAWSAIDLLLINWPIAQLTSCKACAKQLLFSCRTTEQLLDQMVDRLNISIADKLFCYLSWYVPARASSRNAASHPKTISHAAPSLRHFASPTNKKATKVVFVYLKKMAGNTFVKPGEPAQPRCPGTRGHGFLTYTKQEGHTVLYCGHRSLRSCTSTRTLRRFMVSILAVHWF